MNMKLACLFQAIIFKAGENIWNVTSLVKEICVHSKVP